jgi:site-specific recombinase XerC
MIFTGLRDSSQLRSVTHAHVIVWRKQGSGGARAGASYRAAQALGPVSSRVDYLCQRNAVLGNPVDGVKRPATNNNEGSTLPLGMPRRGGSSMRHRPTLLGECASGQSSPPLLYHGIRREELRLLRLRDMQSRQGVRHLRFQGKRAKIRFIAIHRAATHRGIPPDGGGGVVDGTGFAAGAGGDDG